MSRPIAMIVGLSLLLASCGSRDDGTAGTTAAPAATNPPTTTTVPTTTTIAATTTLTSTTTSTTSTTTTTTTLPRNVVVETGDRNEVELEIHLSFRSEVDGIPTDDFAAFAISTLNDPQGWSQAGFAFVSDDASELEVVLAEPATVDALCLPLQTRGTVSCQNGAVVALNADRWRGATDDWDSSVEDYRIYLINHEVGHLIGLRHPVQRCPSGEDVSAVMEPQTKGLEGCAGNGWPLGWEIDWALNRPVKIGPTPDWDGPRPSWP